MKIKLSLLGFESQKLQRLKRFLFLLSNVNTFYVNMLLIEQYLCQRSNVIYGELFLFSFFLGSDGLSKGSEWSEEPPRSQIIVAMCV